MGPKEPRIRCGQDPPTGRGTLGIDEVYYYITIVMSTRYVILYQKPCIKNSKLNQISQVK